MLPIENSGIVLWDKPYKGTVAPTKLADRSRWGNDGVHTDITMVQLPSGLWVRSFNGSTSKIECTSAPSIEFTTDTSILMWAKLNDVSTTYTFIAKSNIFAEDRFILRTTDAGYVQLFKESANDGGLYVVGPEALATTNWSFYELQFGSGGIKMFVDLVDAGTNANTAVLTAGTHTSLLIGIDYGVANLMKGLIALPKILNYKLTTSQRYAIFQKERHLFGV